MTWAFRPSGTHHHLLDVQFLDHQNVIAVGGGWDNTWMHMLGVIVRSTDGGETWTVRAPVGNRFLRAVAFSDERNGTAVGDYGTIFRTTDGGEHWNDCSVPIIQNLMGVAFGDAGKGLIVGGRMFRTENGGASWAPDSTSFRSLLSGVTFCGGSRAVMVGESGTIIAVDWQGPTAIADGKPLVPETPRSLTLSQNYPNPFNPSTTIRYGLPARSHVSLTVFNTLGQKVATLQNAERDPGYHEVRFDGANIPSGVYFYRLQAGSYTETKKLLLLR
jgi:photosystem II stability/assembly factor-like uncharacterized protein